MKRLTPNTFAYTGFLSAAVALGPLGTDMYLASMPVLELVFNATVTEIQWTLSAFVIGIAAFQLVVGPLTDRFGRKNVLMWGLAVFSVACFASMQAQTHWELTFYRVVQSFGVCTGVVIPRAMVRDLFEREQAARQLSLMGTIMGLAPAVAPVIGGFIAVLYGWEAIFFFMGAYGVLVIIVCGFLIDETLGQRDHMAMKIKWIIANYKELISHREYQGFVFTTAFCFGGFFTYISASSFVLINVMGVPVDRFGFYFGFVIVGFVIGTLIGPKMTARWSLRRSLQIGTFVTLAGAILLAALAVSGVHHPLAIVIPMLVYDLGVGIVMPQCQAGAMHPFPEKAGAASALSGFIVLGLSALFGLAAAELFNGSQMPMVWIVLALALLTFGFFHATIFRAKSLK